MDQVAVGVYPITSLFVSHSCRPNAAVLYKQGTQSLLTLDDILPGEPITIAYVDVVSTKAQRTQALKEKFGQDYACHCTRCEGDLAIVDVALDKGESLGFTEQDGMELMSKHIRSWSVLDMVKHAEAKEKDNLGATRICSFCQSNRCTRHLLCFNRRQKTPSG